MIRIRLRKGLRELDFLEKGFVKVTGESATYYSKRIGTLEVQVKLSYPGNIRIKDWDDSEAPWILYEFLKALDGKELPDRIRIRRKIINVQDGLRLIEELTWFSDILKRLKYWFKEGM